MRSRFQTIPLESSPEYGINSNSKIPDNEFPWAAIANFECHESIKDALQARFNTLNDSGIFTNDH